VPRSPLPLRVGLQLPQWGDIATRETILDIARAAEAAGFDSVWASDHVVHPLTGPADYPYAAGGPPFRPEWGYLEALTTLAVIAGATERVRLGTSVLLLPMRETLLAGKQIATLDVLSGGRVSIAVAAGWWRSEFEALGADFDSRSRRLDEQIHALRALWSSGSGEWRGQQVRFPPVALRPTPVQPAGPELWIGGRGPRVWRRVAATPGAGWHGIGFEREQMAEARAAIVAACRVAGRDPATVRYSTATGMPADRERLLRRLLDLAECGLTQVVLIPRAESRDAILTAVSQYGEWVRQRLDAAHAEC
jgi:probable F420-dependent oxidoreductase